jgi:hypothetical protein
VQGTNLVPTASANSEGHTWLRAPLWISASQKRASCILAFPRFFCEEITVGSSKKQFKPSRVRSNSVLYSSSSLETLIA